MGVSVRPATVDDLLAMQRCNLLCLPENYQLKVSFHDAARFDTPPLVSVFRPPTFLCVPRTI